jgi:hypothetical protein
MGARNNYGQVNDVRLPIEVLTGAAIAFKAAGGKFVTGYGGALVLAVPQALGILGWAEIGEITTATTDKITVNTAWDAIYEMPIDAARTVAQLDALVGKACDIIVTTGIQYADFDATTDDTLQIMGYGYYGPNVGDQTLFVRLNEKTVTKTGV